MKFRLVRDCLLQAVFTILLSVGLAAFSTAALAANVDYEDKPLGAVTPNVPLVFDHPLYITAIDVSSIEDGEACSPNCPDNGTKYQLSLGAGFAGLLTIRGEPLPVSCPDCSPFDLFEIDIAEPSPGSGPISLFFYGTTASGEAVEFNFVSDGVFDGPGGQPDFETVVLPDTFRDLGSMSILVAAPYLGVALDNIILEPDVQPAPALAPLSLGALALLLGITATWLGRKRAEAR